MIVRPVTSGGGAGGSQPISRASVPASVVAQVRSVAGVAAADGAVTDRAGIIGSDGKIVGGRSGIGASYRS